MSGNAAIWWMLIISAGASVGFVVGVAYFAHLRGATASIVSGASPWHAAGAAIMRLTAAGLVFFLLAKLGAGAVVGGLAGFTFARRCAIAVARREQ
jgi:hypothetical protein